MRELLAKNGELVTLIFPIPMKKVDPNEGPPYPMSLDLHKELLESAGFVLESHRVLPPELCHPSRDGSSGKISALARWRIK